MGKTSRRKSQRRRGIGPSRADFEKRRDYQMLLTGMQSMVNRFDAEKGREQQARRAWADGAEPPRATLARWREDSVGDRFFSGKTIADVVGAPRLADAVLPSPQQMAQNSRALGDRGVSPDPRRRAGPGPGGRPCGREGAGSARTRRP